MALAFGALLAAFPASASTITFTTGPNATNLGTGADDYNFAGADVSTAFNPTTGGGTTFNLASLSASFGEFIFKSDTPNTAVVSVDVTPTINGVTASTAIDFSGTIAVSGGIPTVKFSGSTETINGNTYVYQVSNGVQYAIEQTQNLPTSLNKTSYLVGFVGVPFSTTPEPATVATTGLALVLVGLVARRKTMAKS
jgi:hypothetical protein